MATNKGTKLMFRNLAEVVKYMKYRKKMDWECPNTGFDPQTNKNKYKYLYSYPKNIVDEDLKIGEEMEVNNLEQRLRFHGILETTDGLYKWTPPDVKK